MRVKYDRTHSCDGEYPETITDDFGNRIDFGDRKECLGTAARLIGGKEREDGGSGWDAYFLCPRCAGIYREALMKIEGNVDYDEPILTGFMPFPGTRSTSIVIVAPSEIKGGDISIKTVLENKDIRNIKFEPLPEPYEGNRFSIYGEVWKDDYSCESVFCLPVSEAAIKFYYNKRCTEMVASILGDFQNLINIGVRSGDIDLSDELVTHILYKYVNDMSLDGKKNGVGVRLANEHPTIQQSFMREVVIPFLKTLAEKPYVDARNEASASAAKLILPLLSKILEEIYIPYV